MVIICDQLMRMEEYGEPVEKAVETIEAFL